MKIREVFKKIKTWFNNICFHDWEFYSSKCINSVGFYEIDYEMYYVCMKCGKKRKESFHDSTAQKLADDDRRYEAAREKAKQTGDW